MNKAQEREREKLLDKKEWIENDIEVSNCIVSLSKWRAKYERELAYELRSVMTKIHEIEIDAEISAIFMLAIVKETAKILYMALPIIKPYDDGERKKMWSIF